MAPHENEAELNCIAERRAGEHHHQQSCGTKGPEIARHEIVTEQATLARHGHAHDVRRRRLVPNGARPVRDDVGVGRSKCSENGQRGHGCFY